MLFDFHVGIDYSGAKTPQSRLAGLQVYSATDGDPTASTHTTPRDQHRNWSREELAGWLIEQVRTGGRFIAGIDHAFSFPQSHFSDHGIKSWHQFLDDFVKHWPTDQPDATVERFREQNRSRTGKSSQLRLTDKWTSSAKSVFLFDVQGQVAKSTHAGIPWLRKIRHEVGDRVHFWPFDGWSVHESKSVIAEVYPSIFRKRFQRSARNDHQQDAYAISRWLTDSDRHGILNRYFEPPLTDAERRVASLEGWILGIG